MGECKNTLACIFDPASPRISAHELHECIFSSLKVNEKSIIMIQNDGARRQVFLKFTEQHYANYILNETNGCVEYKHTNGETSLVKLELAGLGARRVTVANLPPELSAPAIRSALAPYGVVQSIREEKWATHYRYIVANGERVIQMTLTKHLPSHLNIAGFRALITYEGQPQTCYGCGQTDHMYQMCPKRRDGTRRWEVAATQGENGMEFEETRQSESEDRRITERKSNRDILMRSQITGSNAPNDSLKGDGKCIQQTMLTTVELDKKQTDGGGVKVRPADDPIRNWTDEASDTEQEDKRKETKTQKEKEWPNLPTISESKKKPDITNM
jgi:hypothetical protein